MGFDYALERKIGYIPLKEGFSANYFILKYVKKMKFYMVLFYVKLMFMHSYEYKKIRENAYFSLCVR